MLTNDGVSFEQQDPDFFPDFLITVLPLFQHSNVPQPFHDIFCVIFPCSGPFTDLDVDDISLL